MRIAILALQGAFIEHQQMLERLGVESFQVRSLADWQQPKDGLIIPGGESTAMTRIIRDEGLFEPVRDAILGGLPVFGTCAGLIMLDHNHLGTMDIVVRRNAYGRQLGSFVTVSEFTLPSSFNTELAEQQNNKGTKEQKNIPMTFIRAPYIESVGEGVEVLATVDGHIVAAAQGKQFVTAFHPELNDDLTIHKTFISMCSGS